MVYIDFNHIVDVMPSQKRYSLYWREGIYEETVADFHIGICDDS